MSADLGTRYAAGGFCHMIGADLDQGQLASLDAILCQEPGGQVILAGSGADAVLSVAVLAWLLVNGDDVLWLTRRPEAARAAFERVAHLARGPVIASSVSLTRRSNGDQQIGLRTGARVLFRTWDRARGYSARRLIVGNADLIGWQQAGSVMHVLLGRNAGKGQVVYTAQELRGEVLESLRDNGPALLEA